MMHDNTNAPTAPPTSAGTGAILCGWAIWLAIMLGVTLWTGVQLLSPAQPPDSMAAFVAPVTPPGTAGTTPDQRPN